MTATTGSDAPPSEKRTASDLPTNTKSIFREPKSERWTHASRPIVASARCSHAQPLTGARDGRSLRAASAVNAYSDIASTSAGAQVRRAVLRADILLVRAEQGRDRRIRQAVQQRAVGGEIPLRGCDLRD